MTKIDENYQIFLEHFKDYRKIDHRVVVKLNVFTDGLCKYIKKRDIDFYTNVLKDSIFTIGVDTYFENVNSPFSSKNLRALYVKGGAKRISIPGCSCGGYIHFK